MKLIKNLILFSCLFGSSLIIPAKQVRSVNAAEEQEKILTTNPFEDLIQDEQFKTDYLNGVYKFQKGADIEFLNLSEYKYQNTYTENYGLFVYFYNPDDSRKIDLFSDANKIELSTDGTHYYNYNLKPVSRSVDEIQDMFYKFRVDTNQDFYNSLNSAERTYYVSSYELKIRNENQIHDVEIGQTLKFTGYASGCNGNTESTLECYKEGLETIHLKTHAGYKRSGAINDNLSKHIDLQYVYFEIPNKYITTYGQPYSVSYEFYDCYTDKGIFNIRKKDAYIEKEWWQAGDNCGSSGAYFLDPWKTYSVTELDYNQSIFSIVQDDIETLKTDEALRKWDPKASSPYYLPNLNNWSTLSNEEKQFYRDNQNNYTPTVLGDRLFRKDNADSEITSKDIEELIKKYGLTYLASNQIYSGPIEKTIDDIEEPTSINPNMPNLSWWESLCAANAKGDTPWGRTQAGGTSWENVKSFEVVESRDDSNGSIYTINPNDVEKFNEIYDDTIDNDTTLCILRFNEAEYWTAPVYFYREPLLLGNERYTQIGYSAFMHIIDRFNILSLTFRMNDKYTVIPVVSDPQRIVPGATSPVDDRPEDYSWWNDIKKIGEKINIKAIIGIVAGIILLFIILKLVFKLIDVANNRKIKKAAKQISKEKKREKKPDEKE